MTALPPNLSDQLTDALLLEQAIAQRLTTQLDRFGYWPVAPPLIEHADLFLIKAGDAAISRLVSFELSGQTLCLRPEFTAPAARAYIEHFQDAPGTVRLQFNGPILQYESLSHGEITQQNAIGAELINERGPAADAEIIALAAQLLKTAGIPSWHLTIGHSGLIERFLERYELNRRMRRFVLEKLALLRQGSAGLEQATAELLTMADDNPRVQPTAENNLETEAALHAILQATSPRGPSGGRTRQEIARRLLEKQQRTEQKTRTRRALEDLYHLLSHAKTPGMLLAHLQGDPLQATAQHIADVFDLLSAYGIDAHTLIFDLSFTRNLDYYTGIVFEYRSGQHSDSRLFGGGGRYDEMLGLLGSRASIPSVGFMLYMNQIIAATPRDLSANQKIASLLIIPDEATPFKAVLALAAELRQAGVNVTTGQRANPLPTSPSMVGELQSNGLLKMTERATGDVKHVTVTDGIDSILLALGAIK